MRIKICGMSEQRRIDEAASLGVDFCGFVFHEKRPRNVTPSQVSLLDTHGMKRVGVFVNQRADEMREIIRIAREIGTYETSILPYEDCCTVFTPRHPATRPALEDVRAAEAALDVDALVAEALSGETWIRVKITDEPRI